MIAYFIRHGQPEYPRDAGGNLLIYGPDGGLSAAGKEWARAVAQAILLREGGPLDRLVTSPYARAKQTAQVIAGVMGIDPSSIVEDFRLRDTDSTWPGEPRELFMRAWDERRVFEDPHTKETLVELKIRMTSAVDEQIRRFDGEMTGFIVHGDPLRAWLFPDGKPIPSYREFVDATFDAGEGVRMEKDADEKFVMEIIGDFTVMGARFGYHGK